jgi:CHAT domain-containing protein
VTRRRSSLRQCLLHTLAWLLATLVTAAPALAQDAAALRDRLAAGTELLRSTPARDVIESHLRPVAEAALLTSDDNLKFDALIALGGTYQRIGMTTLALDALTHAQAIAEQLRDPARAAMLRDSLGLAYRAQGRYSLATETLEDGLRLAREANRRDLEAAILNDLALTRVMAGEDESAKSGFRQSQDIAADLSLYDLQATACINAARLAVDRGQMAGVEEQLRGCRQAAEKLDSAARRSDHASAIGTIFAHGTRYHSAPAAWRLQAFEAFRLAQEAAEQADDMRRKSYALGYIGGLYEDEGRHEEALDYSRQAAFLAQLADAPEGLYLWQWQIAKALRALGDNDGAVAAYRQSIVTLNSIKDNLVADSSNSFRERVGPVFFELADLLLENVANVDDPAQVERDLRAVRDTIEQVKVAEVQEYFNNACMIGGGSSEALESVAANAAIIYPILFDDRIELLVSLPSGLKRYRSDIGLKELTREVRLFRRGIERYDGQDAYLDQGYRLYSWLIEPIVSDLETEGVDTLVMVPDGPLRTIPMSALYDGERFMIERFAFATTPGLTLTDPQPLQRENAATLAVGLTEAVQGFSALPNVGQELDNITSLFPATTYRDEEFRGEQVEAEIARGDYSIVHVATHGQFDSDHTRSFLLTYDEKLTMDELRQTIGARQYKDDPVELLVLSACETAAGDDRAALGLAGVALQAGARTAVATLWFINDQSTSEMVSEFYRQLDSSKVSKAEALRAAQLFLLEQPQYRHPSYWAPFLLIGNWL